MRFTLYLLLLCSFSSCYYLRAYKVRKFQLTDHQRLPSVAIPASSAPGPFFNSVNAPQYYELKSRLDNELAGTLTAAFLVIRNDSIIYENYFNGFTQASLLPSFSVAKSFISTLVEIAREEGKIKSLQDPVTNYLPELLKNDSRFSRITLQHLLDMRSGLKWKEESYGLKDDAIKLGFRPNLRKYALKIQVEKEPGQEFHYQSINTELLALSLERATGKKVSVYIKEKLWQPLGAEYPGTWNVDSKKHQQEIAYAGLNATARDFAKLGQLFLNKGNWKGRQIIDSSWVQTVASADTMQKYGGYKNQWWSFRRLSHNSRASTAMPQSHSAPYHAQGLLKQFIYVNPMNNVVIVRLGRNWSHPEKYAEQFIYDLGSVL